MTAKFTLITALIASAIALSITAPKAQAQYDSTLSRDAHRIDSIAHELSEEFRLHYRNIDAYSHPKSDISQIISKTHHIDRLTHDAYASLRHITTDVRAPDRLARHLHRVVDRAEDDEQRHVEGNTRHVHSLLSSLNRAIHSMERTLEQMREHGHDGDHGGHAGEAARGLIRLAIERSLKR